MDVKLGLSATARNLVECRICHDEDEESNMDSPCACRGSLKYAHHCCIQTWCNNKGNTVCEICLQHYKQQYSCPPPPFDVNSASVHSRGHGEVPSTHPYYPLGPLVVADDSFGEPGLFEYPSPGSWSIICCRMVTVLFLILLIMRLSLPIIIAGDGEYHYALLWTMLMASSIGVVCSFFTILRACAAIRLRERHGQLVVDDVHLTASPDEENGPRDPQVPLHFIEIQ